MVTSPAGVRYLSGFSGSAGVLYVLPEIAVLVTDGRYSQQAAEELHRTRVFITPDSPFEESARRGLLSKCRRVGFEESDVSVERFRLIRRSFPGLRFVPAQTLLWTLAAVKDKEEISAITRAARISDAVFREIITFVQPGMTEHLIAAEISYRQRMHGAERDAFEPIVASGPRSALPHARPSNRRIRAGEPLLLDFGCVVDGYAADMSRTICLGRPPRWLVRIHSLVREAQERALLSIFPDVPAASVDAVARMFIAKSGHADHFGHSLGHGLGLRLHEGPRIAPRSPDILREGNVATVEPGVYLPGRGGVRIEDDVVVRSGGCEILTTSTKELLIQ